MLKSIEDEWQLPASKFHLLTVSQLKETPEGRKILRNITYYQLLSVSRKRNSFSLSKITNPEATNDPEKEVDIHLSCKKRIPGGKKKWYPNYTRKYLETLKPHLHIKEESDWYRVSLAQVYPF